MGFVEKLKLIFTQPSTWNGITVLLAWIGYELTPEHIDKIMVVLGAVYFIINVFWKRDTQSQKKQPVNQGGFARVSLLTFIAWVCLAGLAIADAYLVCDPQADNDRYLVRITNNATGEAYVPPDAGGVETVPEDGLEYFTANHEEVEGQGIRIMQRIADIPPGDYTAIARAANGWGRSDASTPSEFTRPSLTPPAILQLDFSISGP